MSLRQRGYMDRILRIDLGSGKVSSEPLPGEDVMRLLLGGKGLGAYLLYKELSTGVDPLGPENKLILDVGPLTGTTSPTAGRLGSTTKSPATGTYSDAYCGGYFGQTMKYAGYDAIVLEGAASEAVMLVIDNERVEICSAQELWGSTIPEATAKARPFSGSSRTWAAARAPSAAGIAPGATVSARGDVATRTPTFTPDGTRALAGAAAPMAVAARAGTARSVAAAAPPAEATGTPALPGIGWPFSEPKVWA